MIARLRPLLQRNLHSYSKEQVDVHQLSYSALAFVGDSVWDLAIRERALWPIHKWQSKPVKQRYRWHQQLSQAETQAEIATRLVSSFGLNKEEEQVLYKGRHAAGKAPRNVDRKIYASATGFEALVGYLHYSDPQRLEELFQYCWAEIEQISEQELRDMTNRRRR